LGNYEKIFQSLKGAYETLYGEQKGLDWVGRSMGELESIADLDESYKKMFEDVSNSYFMLEEMTYTLRDTIEQLEFNPDRLEMIENRLHDISFVKRKYGDSVNEILQYRDEISAEVDLLTHS